MPEETLDAALRETDFGELAIPAGSTVGAVDVLVAAGLAASRGAARRTIGEGGASVNNVRIADDQVSFTAADAVAGRWLVVRRGSARSPASGSCPADARSRSQDRQLPSVLRCRPDRHFRAAAARELTASERLA